MGESCLVVILLSCSVVMMIMVVIVMNMIGVCLVD